MKNQFFFLFCASILVGCTGSTSKNEVEAETVQLQSTAPYAELGVPSSVDMGVFEGSQLEKSTTILLKNTGTDTLYVTAAIPDCDCTVIQRYDSVIAPGHNGSLTVSLNLKDYPNDTIRKDFGILSNDRRERVKRVMLVGLRK